MGIKSFLSLFKRKELATSVSTNSAHASNYPEHLSGRTAKYPVLVTGASLDILNQEDDFLFSARLVSFTPAELKFDRIPGMFSFPVLEVGSKVHIRGYVESQEPFKLEATVTHSSRLFLDVTDMEPIACEYRRESFRQPINMPAEIYDPEGTRMRKPQKCQLVDISINGACVTSDREYEIGQTVRLRVELYPKAGHISFIGEIMRIDPHLGDKKKYGILFAQMDRDKKQMLLTDIQEVQRRVNRSIRL